MPKVTREPAEDRDDFVKRLKECANRVGSLTALARDAKITQSTIRGYTDRGAEPPRDVLVKLAKAGGVSVQWLATGEATSELERDPPPQNPVVVDQGEGISEIAASIARRYGVSHGFALKRLMSSEEFITLETSIREWCGSRPIPVLGDNKPRIWGMLSQEDFKAAFPSSQLKDIRVYQVRTGHLETRFYMGDWAIVDGAKEISAGDYCVIHKGVGREEIRKITIEKGQLKISGSLDQEESSWPLAFMTADDLKKSFVVIGRLIGAIRFVVTEQPSNR